MANLSILVLITFHILLFLALHVRANEEEKGNDIIFDVSQDVRDLVQKEDEVIADKANNALKSVIIQSIKRVENYIMYYQADMTSHVHQEIEDVINVLDTVKKDLPSFQPKLLLSIKESTGVVEDLNTTEYIQQNYAEILALIANQNSVVVALSIDAAYLENLCYQPEIDFESQQHPLTSVISEIREFITNSSRLTTDNTENTLKLGYEVHINSLNCSHHLMNMDSADFLVIQIPLKRNDNYFVESYGLFIENLENEIMSLASNEMSNKPVYYIKLSLTATLDPGPLHAFFRDYKDLTEQEYHQDEEEWLDDAKDGLVNIYSLTARRYENLMTQYMQEWIRTNEKGSKKIIISYLYGYPYFKDTDLFDGDKVTAKMIPYVTNIPIQGTTSKNVNAKEQLSISLEESTDIFLQDVASGGFETMMIPGRAWDELISRNMDFPRCQFGDFCRPKKILYLIQDGEHMENIKRSPESIKGLDGINVDVVVFSNSLNDLTVKDWGEVINSLQDENNQPTPACQIRTFVFNKFYDNRICNNPDACNAVHLRREFGFRCKPGRKNIADTIIWMETVEFDKLEAESYELGFFVDKIMKKMHSFVIGREMILNKFPETKNVILQLTGNYSGDYSWTGSTTLYCNDFAEKIGQFYEVILTWALIHNFPVILEPADDTQFRYDNPLAWKQLESSSSLHDVMNAGPLYIRRSYSRSKVFGSWTNGMYPCISKATKETIKIINFNNGYTGVTLNMGLRQENSSLSPEEIQTLLLFSLQKFSTVEISLLKQEDFIALRDTLAGSNFLENLKINQIDGKIIYLNVVTLETESDDGTLNEIVSGFKNAGFQVNVHTSVDFLNNTIPGSDIGVELENCSIEAERLVLNATTAVLETNLNFLGISYIVCPTDMALATNKDEKQMQDYLDSHLYLKKLLQYFYPNLKRIYFRLQSKLDDSDAEDMDNLMMFLSDINNFAKSYKIHYFILPAFPTENNTEGQASIWKITDFTDLTDLSMFREYQSDYFNETTWVPKISPQENTNLLWGEVDVQQLHLIIFPTLFLMIFLVIGVIIFVRCRYCRLSSKEIQQFHKGHQVTLKRAVDERRNKRYTVNLFDGLVFQEDYQIKKNEISLNKNVILGQGKFSVVYLATLKKTDVCAAVKIAKRSCSTPTFKEMLSEVKLLCYLGNHVNLVRFIGCYTKEIRKGVLWVVTEHCGGGSLHVFLHDNGDNNSIDPKALIKFSLEIATGMEYIVKQKIIHGDLCTSNVLLDGEHKNCKIYGCGGLSKKMADHRKCMKKNKEPSNWQWMSYEVIKQMAYSMESDVWSFGVTVWEIFNFGDIPFSNVSWSPNFADDLENGLRLKIPQLAPKEIFGVMLDCWNAEIKNRPHFSKLVDQFHIFAGEQDNFIVYL